MGAGEGGRGVEAGALYGLGDWRVSWSGGWMIWVVFGGGGGSWSVVVGDGGIGEWFSLGLWFLSHSSLSCLPSAS